ncbi:MAG TPA: OmpH family outer membrane protein [Caulobacteraceae bacterium]|nr:OmpH family outer membrane protein [Caulobacteraceae bacterium]
MHRLTAAALAGVLAAVAFAPLAQAQSGAAASAPTGPAIPGLCFLSKDGLVANSTVGKFVESRLQQLGQQAEAELNAQGTSLQNDAKALDAQRASLSTDQLNQRGAALEARQRDLERQVQIRRQEMAATEQKALSRVLQEASPIIQSVFRQRNCTVLLDANAALIATQSMDITPAVVDGLNGKITQFTFDREHIDPNAAAQPSGQ